jgi:hypothetical protein
LNNPAFSAQPPKALESVLSQQSDGQLRLVVPERDAVEKQITGQLNIDDILLEWERMKQEREERCKEEVRRHVKEQTGTMFTEFEAAIRDGLLEKLAKDFTFNEMERVDAQHRAVRFCTSWATKQESVDALCDALVRYSAE